MRGSIRKPILLETNTTGIDYPASTLLLLFTLHTGRDGGSRSRAVLVYNGCLKRSDYTPITIMERRSWSSREAHCKRAYSLKLFAIQSDVVKNCDTYMLAFIYEPFGAIWNRFFSNVENVEYGPLAIKGFLIFRIKYLRSILKLYIYRSGASFDRETKGKIKFHYIFETHFLRNFLFS